MGESNVMKPKTGNSNLSRISSTADNTSSSIKIVDPFAFVEVKCEVEVSSVFSPYSTKILRLQSLHSYGCTLIGCYMMTWECEEALMMYVEVSPRHFVVEIGLACKILSTIRFFIVAPTQALISYIRLLSADCDVVLYVHCWSVSSASACSYSEHCPNYEMCFFSKSTHLRDHITL